MVVGQLYTFQFKTLGFEGAYGPSSLRVPFHAMSKFDDVKVDLEVDHLEHFRSGKVPRHLTILYEPKTIKVGNKRHMVQFRYCPTKKKFCWKIFNRPLIRNAARTEHPIVDLSRTGLDLDEVVILGREDGEIVWTTKLCVMEDVMNFLKYYDVDSNGKIYVAVPGFIPIFHFGRQGLPYPPMKGKCFSS